MNHLKLIKGACCALMMMSSEYALAGWEDINTDVNITNSRAVLDRVNRVYFTYVTVENTGSEALDGPFRVMINDATLPVVNAQGTSDGGVPYFDLDMAQLMPGESHKVRVDFELQRKRLTFTASLQNDVEGWELVWSDEFDGTEIDTSKWSHEINCDGGGNNEKQCYTASEENSFVEDGKLKIVAKSANGQPLPYSSARLRTVDKADWTYGRFEIRAKAPIGQGSWPAIWMLPTDRVYGGWPHSGEIDIFEAVNLGVPLNEGGVESNVHGTLHYGESWPNNDSSGHNYLLPSGDNPADDFHTYAIEWEEGEMRWYVDGVLYQTQQKSEVTYNTDGNPDGLAHRGWYREDNGEYFWDNSPFDQRFHMILNFAVGGSWPENVNQGGIDASAFDGNNKFEIDYVRVYECSVMPSTGQGCATVADGYLDSIEDGGTLNEGAAPTPIPPSDGIARDLIIFDEAINEAWPAWDCCGGSIPTIEYEDGDYLNVVEFVVGNQPTVLGFNTNFADIPKPYDGSPMLDTGVLEFDLKLVTPPNNAAAGWNLKVEQGGTTTEAVIAIDTPTSEWQHYTIPLKTLSDAGLNLNGIDVIMIFPDWGLGEGAVFRVDNVTILEGEVDTGGDGGSESDLPAIDFEVGGYGASFNWNVFENADNPALELVANPDTSGINDSSTVAKMTARAAGAPWVGVESAHGDFGPMTIDASNSTVKIMVYKSVISDVGIKFAIPSGGAQGEIKVANTLINQWEELTFDFSGYIGLPEAIDIDQIIFFPDFDFGGRAQDNLVYFDNIRFFGENTGEGDGGGEPSGDELLTNGDFESGTQNWIGNVEVIAEEGNNVFYANVLAAGNPWDVNLSQVMTLVPDETYLVSFKAKSPVARSIVVGLGLNHDPWTNLVENVVLTDQWQTYTYTITTGGFGDDNSRVLFDLGADVGELFIDDVSVKIQGEDGGDGGGSSSDLPALDFEAGGYGASFNWNVFENADNPAIEFVANPDMSGINDSSTVAKIIARAAGAPWVGTETAHGDFGPMTLDVSNSIIKVMVYKSVISDVAIKFAIPNGGAQGEIKVANTLINQWEELTFDFSGYIGLPEAIGIDQIIVFPDFDLGGRAQDNVVYFDNIRFFGEDGSDGGDGGDGGTGGDEQVSNGSFDNGNDGWNGGSIGTEDGNSFFFAEVANAGNPWDVSLSQVMTLLPDSAYVLSFKAKSSLPRSIIAGLGLNHDPWTSATETVGLTTAWQTYTYTITTSGFGDDNSRVLFDLGAEVGTVFIDDVSVVLQDTDGGDGGGDVPEQAPILQNSPPLSADAGEEYSFQMLVTDVNNDDITFSEVTLPAFLSLSDSGLIAGMPLESDIGQYDISVTFSDGQFTQELIYTLFVNEAYLVEPPEPYVRTPVDANDPSTFNIINYGAGNIADGINPDGYDCVIDYGTWINSAGVTEPGVNGCDPIGDPVYRHPQVIGEIINDPVPTHKWWGSIPFLGEMSIGDPSNAAYITPDPIVARISNKGVRVLGIPSGIRGDDGKFLYAIPDPFNEVFDGVAVANSAFDQLDAYLKNYSDGSVTVQWQSGNKPVMEATFVHGSPYIYFKAFRGQIVLKTKAVDSSEKGTFYQQGDSLGIWTSVAGNRNSYLITGEGATSFDNIASNVITVNNSANEMTLTLLPTQGSDVPNITTSDFFANLARNVVSKVNIDYAVDRSDNSVTVSHRYLDAQGNSIETLAGMMPMAWKNSNQPLSDYKVRSARGMVRFSQTTEFDYEIPFVGVLPYLPSTIADFDQQYLVNLVNEFASQDPVQWNVNNDGNVNYDTYWSGKSYSKMAEMAAIARSIGMNAQADIFVDWLKAELEDWFTADTNGSLDTEKYFVYDQEWSTVLGMKETFGSHQQLNDHHFHYGYFVRAAAEVCRVDAAWCGQDQFGPMIELLIRDYAADKGDDMFPYLRNFDPANGFSWASGNANFVLGNNNESTSEAANAYGAIALYGMITGNNALVEKGMYLHASSTSAYWEYWNNLDRYRNESADYPDRGDDYDNFPQSFDKLTTSIIWGTGSSFSTWFSGKYAHILGIQGLPLNPLVLHVGQHPDYMKKYVELGLTESTNGKPSGLGNDEWRDIWWNLWAMTDADAAFADYQTMGSNYGTENGESKAHTYHWVKTWQKLGHLKTGTGALTADHPAAVAFNNSGNTTYVAYNYGASEITVTYSDGQQLVVAPESFEIVVVEGDDSGNEGDSGDDGDSGDGGGTGDELVSNGSFDNNGEGWIGEVNVVLEGDNNVFMADVATAGNPWDVNLSYPLTLTPDDTYILSFKAKASLERTIVAGLGFNYDPWTNIVETVSLNTQWQTFSYTMTLSGFGGENSRVLFDLGGDAGVVYIDDVSVTLQESTDGGGPVAEDTFVLISSSGASDIEFVADTVGEWSTGTTIQDDVTFDGSLGWELTSSSNSPEAGNWGTVLAFQNGVNGDFSLFNRIELKIATSGTYAGGYKVAISGNGVNKEFGLPVNEAISTWQTVSLDAANIPINFSSIDWIAVYGIGGQAGTSTIHVTDFSLLNDGTTTFDSSTEDDFVFISSNPAVSTDLIVDDDNYSDVGNVIFGEWSTGTIISDTTYDGLDGIQLSANGSWGAVLALQGDISDGSNIDNYDVDLSQYTNIKMKVASQGAFERYALSIVSKIGDKEVAQEVGFTLANQTQWNEIDIDLGMYGVDLSNVSQIALFGVYQGGSAGQSVYMTDLIAYDTGKVGTIKDSSDDKFVFFSSTGESTDMVFDNDDYAHNGNMTINDWSTGTLFASDVTYNGLNSFELTRGNGWGAVLALMGDINGDVQEYDIDVAEYSTLNFKIAAQGAFSEYTLDFLVDGAEFKVPLSVNSSWTDVSINLADIPINFSKLTQIAIFGAGGGAGNKIYLTDYHLTK